MKYLIAPHNDDETLFASFTICREEPIVVIVYDGYVQSARGEAVTAEERRQETIEACKILGAHSVVFLGLRDDRAEETPPILDLLHQYCPEPTEIWAPAYEVGGNRQHNRVATACRDMLSHPCCAGLRQWFPALTCYVTYTSVGKSVGSIRIDPQPEWIVRKLRAMACYESQIRISNCREHFVRGLEEYHVD
jgi:LmbE family N-acetylglucosaminyl deacetylase